MEIKRFWTPRFSPYSVKWSPFSQSRLALSSAQMMGLHGRGKQHILDVRDSEIVQIREYEMENGCFDCAWNEENENNVVSACADGILRLWDLSSPDCTPLRRFSGHTKEVYTVEWNLVGKDRFISGSFDNSIKLWSPLVENSVITFTGHEDGIYSVSWSPVSNDLFISASKDWSLKLWDARVANKPVCSLIGHSGEVLSCDWNKYSENTVYSGSADNTVRTWDLRTLTATTINGHTSGVKKVKANPHSENVIGSASCDKSIVLWSLHEGDYSVLKTTVIHSDFVTGLDFNLFDDKKIASCSWDETLCIWTQ